MKTVRKTAAMARPWWVRRSRTSGALALVALLAESSLLVDVLHAQDAVPAARVRIVRTSVDWTVGLSAVAGGREPYYNNEGRATQLLVARRPADAGRMYAVAVGVRADLGQDCALLPRSTTCAPDAPTVGHLGMLAGYEYRSAGSAIRALFGPALYANGTSNGLGGLVHLSAAVGAPRLAFTVGVNGHLLARSDGSTLRYYASAFGLRFQ